MNPIVILLFAFVVLGSATDYCAKSLCDDSNHIACKNSGSFADSCKEPEILNIDPFKNDIIDRHNFHRNLTAGGGLDEYLPAERMATISWDDELAKLAELNVKQCQMKHDACHNTAAFKYSGQNLAYWAGYPAPTDINKIVLNAIDNWFSEYENTNMTAIDSYYPTPKPNGHFTVMVADRNIKLGCAVLKQFDGKFTIFLVACNYATTNMLNHPIYKSGKVAASKCTTGKNPIYPALCSASEKYEVNKFF